MAVDRNSRRPDEVEQLQTTIEELQYRLAHVTAKNRAMWSLLAEVTRRLHASSASIKAAVSSLLDYDIFWDGSAQHEFLETIDDSVDQGANLIKLMTLAFRSEADDLEIKPENQSLQEILATVLDTIASKMPQTQININIPPERATIFADYGYLAVALRFLVEVLLESEPETKPISISATQLELFWQLDMIPVSDSVAGFLQKLNAVAIQDLMQTEGLSPEKVLKLFTAFQLCQRQNVELKVNTPGSPAQASLRILIPSSPASQTSLPSDV